MLQCWTLEFTAAGLGVPVTLKHFLIWGWGSEIGADPLCLIAMGNTFSSESSPSVLLLCSGSVSSTYPAYVLPILPTLSISIQILICCSFRCFPWDRMGCIPPPHPHIQLPTGGDIFLCHLIEELLVQHVAIGTWLLDIFLPVSA